MDKVQNMKFINVMACVIAVAISSSAFAERGSDKTFEKMMKDNSKAMEQYAISHGKNVPIAKQYKYGMKLDVVNVISVVRPEKGCAVMPAAMTYEDSQGLLNTIRYTVAGTCRKGG